MLDQFNDASDQDLTLAPIEIEASLSNLILDDVRSAWQVYDSPGLNTLTEVTFFDSARGDDQSSGIFNKIDQNNNGKLSRGELAGAVSDPSFKGEEAQTVASLYHTFDDVQGLKPDSFLFNSGITPADLAELSKIKTNRDNSLACLDKAQQFTDTGFSQIDKDSDDVLNREELAEYAQRGGPENDTSKMVGYLTENFDGVKVASNDQLFFESGISKADISEHVADLRWRSAEAGLVKRGNFVEGRVQESQKPSVVRDLYADATDPLASIVPEAVGQGTINNCYLLSSIAGLAQQRPELIRDMIRDNGDGSYNVTFPGESDKSITVTAPTDAELGLYNRGGEQGTWCSVLEKAYGEHRKDVSVFKSDGGTAAEGTDRRAWSREAIKTLTGNEARRVSLNRGGNEPVRSALVRAFSPESPKVVTASIYIHEVESGTNKTTDGFMAGHGYTVLDYNENADNGGEVVIRNPYGIENGTTDGTVTLGLDKFRENFSFITVEK